MLREKENHVRRYVLKYLEERSKLKMSCEIFYDLLPEEV